jgi:dTDP-4-amino-4,6-dideoxygalactose transaminase
MLPTNLAANIGLAQLDRIDSLQERRKYIWETYQNELSTVPGLINPQDACEGDRHSYFTYCIRVPNRDKLAHFLLENEIYTTLRYHPLHLNPLYCQMEVKLENSLILNEDALSIPIHPRMTELDVEKVNKRFFSQKRV